MEIIYNFYRFDRGGLYFHSLRDPELRPPTPDVIRTDLRANVSRRRLTKISRVYPFQEREKENK